MGFGRWLRSLSFTQGHCEFPAQHIPCRRSVLAAPQRPGLRLTSRTAHSPRPGIQECQEMGTGAAGNRHPEIMWRYVKTWCKTSFAGDLWDTKQILNHFWIICIWWQVGGLKKKQATSSYLRCAHVSGMILPLKLQCWSSVSGNWLVQGKYSPMTAKPGRMDMKKRRHRLVVTVPYSSSRVRPCIYCKCGSSVARGARWDLHMFIPPNIGPIHLFRHLGSVPIWGNWIPSCAHFVQNSLCKFKII